MPNVPLSRRRESTVGAAMPIMVFREYPDKRFIVTSFASHLHRVQQVAQAAVANGGSSRSSAGRCNRTSRCARARLHRHPRVGVIDIEETPSSRR